MRSRHSVNQNVVSTHISVLRTACYFELYICYLSHNMDEIYADPEAFELTIPLL